MGSQVLPGQIHRARTFVPLSKPLPPASTLWAAGYPSPLRVSTPLAKSTAAPENKPRGRESLNSNQPRKGKFNPCGSAFEDRVLKELLGLEGLTHRGRWTRRVSSGTHEATGQQVLSPPVLLCREGWGRGKNRMREWARAF